VYPLMFIVDLGAKVWVCGLRGSFCHCMSFRPVFLMRLSAGCVSVSMRKRQTEKERERECNIP